MIIYKTTNLINGKEYVGFDTKNRIDYLGSGKHLNKAIEKYEKVNFKKRILCKCNNVSELHKAEKLYIELYDTFNNGYNLTLGGEGGDTFSGKKHTKKTLLKMSNSAKGRVAWNKRISQSQEHKDKRSKALKGRSYIDLHGEKKAQKLKKISSQQRKGKVSYFKGKKHTDEVKKKMSNMAKKRIINGMKGKKHTIETKNKISMAHSIAIVQYDFEGNIINKYDSIKKAIQITGITSLYHILKISKNNIAGGYVWKYKNK